MKFDLTPPVRFSLWRAFLTLILAGTLGAEPEEAAGRKVRFLAVGELPPFRQELRGDVRYELEPPAGSIPPREVVLGFGGDESEAASLRLGRITAPIKVPAGVGPLLLKSREAGKEAEPWLNIVRPESGDFIVLLWRDPKSATWEKVRSLVLPDDPVNVPAGSVRVVNISPVSVRILIGSERLLLGAGKSFKRILTEKPEQSFQVLLPDVSGNLRSLYSSVITQNPGERSLVLVYRADGEAPRRPLKVTIQREPAPALPKKE